MFGRCFILLFAGLPGLVACDRVVALGGDPNVKGAPKAPPQGAQAAGEASSLALTAGEMQLQLAAVTGAASRNRTPQAKPSACSEEMVLVEGEYCPEVQHHCLRYLDPPGRYHRFRCAEYGEPRCLGKRVHKRFCIDRDEYAPKGEALPANYQSWSSADQYCRTVGKRVCLESEWNFACEGEEMRPYPYGFRRDPSACNADHTDIFTEQKQLRDLRATAGDYPRCVSPFGVRNLSGTLEEFVTRDGTKPAKPAMKGAYWQPSRNHCRAAQTAHDQYYRGIETGFRCCADAPP